MATKGYAAPRGRDAPTAGPWRCAISLADRPSCFRCSTGPVELLLLRGELQRAHESRQAPGCASLESRGMPAPPCPGPPRARRQRCISLGRFADATAALDEGIAIDDAVAAWRHRADLLLYTEHAGRLRAGCYLAWTRFGSSAFRDRALDADRGRRSPSPSSLAHANSRRLRPGASPRLLHQLATASLLRRERAPRRRSTIATASIACRNGSRIGNMCRGWALVGLRQQIGEGIAQIRTTVWPAGTRDRYRLQFSPWLGSARRSLSPCRISSTTRSSALDRGGRRPWSEPAQSLLSKRSCTG